MAREEQSPGRLGERGETAVWVLITQRSQVQILPPLQSKIAGQRPHLSQEGPLALPSRDQNRDRNRSGATSERETQGNG